MRNSLPAIAITFLLLLFLKPVRVSAQDYDDYKKRNTNTSLQGALLNKDSVQCLLLYYQGLKELPDYVTRFKRLKWLELSGNKMEEVPEIIGSLNSLIFLNLSNNNISKLPDFIANLQQLEGLILANNKLDSIPKVLYKLKSLKTLDLRGNNISLEDQDKLSELLPNCSINYF